jgi:predicted amidohydrolase
MSVNMFTIAACQSSSIRGDVAENFRLHLDWVRFAAEHRADAVVFPELSLTGYEPSIAREVALTADSAELSALTELSRKLQVTVIAGCPVRGASASGKPFIGAFIFRPDRPIAVYRKRFLHADEEQDFVGSNDCVVCEVSDQAIGVAICADIDHPEHAADARRDQATIYAAGVMMTPEGVARAESLMSTYAASHRMLAVMANHASPTGGYLTGGRSGIWDETGAPVAQANGGDCLVLAKAGTAGWTGRVLDRSGL